MFSVNISGFVNYQHINQLQTPVPPIKIQIPFTGKGIVSFLRCVQCSPILVDSFDSRWHVQVIYCCI